MSLPKKVLLLSLLMLQLGCSKPLPEATPMKWEEFNVKENHEKRIALDGYLRLPSMGMVSDTMLVDLYKTSEFEGKGFAVSLKIGSGPNQIEKPPKNYSQKDMKIRDKDGNLITQGVWVRVSGQLVFSPGSSILYGPVVIQKL